MRPARPPIAVLLLGLVACGPGAPDTGSSTAVAGAGADPTASSLAELVAGAPQIAGGELTIVDPFDPGRPYFHDFGTIRYGERVRKTFRLANTGSAPVTLQRALGACSCTRITAVRLVREGQEPLLGDPRSTTSMLTIPPGEIGEMVVELDSTKTTANKDKLAIMRLATDAEQTPFLMFELHVLAERLFDVQPGTVNLGDVPQYGGAGKTIQIFQRLPNSYAKLVDVVEASPGLETSLEYISSAALPFWNLTVRLNEGERMGGFRGKVVLSHSDDAGEGDAGRLEVDVYAMVVDPIVLTPRFLSYGSVEFGESARTFAHLKALLPGQRTRVLEAKLSGPSAEHLSVEVLPLGANAEGLATQFKIELLAGAGLPRGKVDATLRLELDDPQVPFIERAVGGLVR